MRTRAVVGSLLAACLAASTAACGDTGSAGSTGAEAPQRDEYVIGSIVSLSGPLTPATEPWKEVQDMWAGANPDIGGVPLRIVTCDDTSTPQGAGACARKLLSEDDADVIVGPNIGVTFSGAKPLLAEAPLSINVSPYATVEPGSPIVSAAASAKDYTEVALRFAADRGWTKLGVLATIDATGEIGVQEQAPLAEEFGLQIETQRMDLTDVSATTQMSVLQQGGPDAIVIWMTGRPASVALKAIQELGMTDTPLIMLQSNLSAGFLGSVEDLLYDQVYVGAYSPLDPESIEDAEQRPRVQDFITRYTEETGQGPDGVGRLIQDAFYLAALTLEETDGNRDEFLGYINGLEDVPLYNMTATFTEQDRHAADLDDLSMFQLVDGQIQPLE